MDPRLRPPPGRPCAGASARPAARPGPRSAAHRTVGSARPVARSAAGSARPTARRSPRSAARRAAGSARPRASRQLLPQPQQPSELQGWRRTGELHGVAEAELDRARCRNAELKERLR